jgi:2'-5' RNA ligase
MRLFVAIELDEPSRAALAALAGRLGAGGDPVAWVPPANFHLTLKFLGEAPAERLPEIEAACGRAAAPAQPFEILLRGAGAFPSPRRPRVIWAGVEAPPADLAPPARSPSEPPPLPRGLIDLAARVEAEIAPLGFPTEKRPFSAHVTIGRVREPHARRRPRPGRLPGPEAGPTLEAALAREAAFAAGPVRVAAIALMRSELRGGGAVYAAERRVPFGGA